jgi:hypothetical protein
MFNFDEISVAELDKAMEAGRYSPEVRKVIAKSTGQPLADLDKMGVTTYKKLLANFIKAAYAPVDADPS